MSHNEGMDITTSEAIAILAIIDYVVSISDDATDPSSLVRKNMATLRHKVQQHIDSITGVSN